MKTIILGCPYGGIKDLENTLLSIIKKDDRIIATSEISGIDDSNIYIGKDSESFPIKSVNVSYIRYPYDLIPPHNKKYSDRENIEFFKTIAILFSRSAVNSFEAAHMARNRVFSLKVANDSGIETPPSIALKKEIFKNLGEEFTKISITKSLGNCYYSDSSKKKRNKFLTDKLLLEEDDGEKAYIYPAHEIAGIDDIQEHINNFSVCYLQKKIIGVEYRVYVVGKKILFYRRADSKKKDKSSIELTLVKPPIIKKDADKLKKIARELKLNYLCLDIIINHKKVFVIDINPFGSLPRGESNRGATLELARFMLNFG